jgi:hypothetical protein
MRLGHLQNEEKRSAEASGPEKNIIIIIIIHFRRVLGEEMLITLVIKI